MRALPVMALGVALLTASAPAIAGCGTRIDTTSAQNSYTITEPVTSLKIDNPVGDTQIEGTDTNTISVTEQLHYTSNPPQTSYPISDSGQLALSYTCPDLFDVNTCSVTYVLKVPRQLAVHIDHKVGSTTLTGLAGPLTLTSSTGNIEATGLTSATVTARASAGTITLGFTTPPTTVDAQAQVGSVTIRLPAATSYTIDAGSQVGIADVTVQQDPGSPHRIRAHSQVGSVGIHNG